MFDWLLVCAVVRCLIVKLVHSFCVVFYVCTLFSVVFDFYVSARCVVFCLRFSVTLGLSVLCCVDYYVSARCLN